MRRAGLQFGLDSSAQPFMHPTACGDMCVECVDTDSEPTQRQHCTLHRIGVCVSMGFRLCRYKGSAIVLALTAGIGFDSRLARTTGLRLTYP